MPRRRGHTLLGILLAVAVAVALTACGGDDDNGDAGGSGSSGGDDPTTTTTDETTTTTADDSPEAQAIAAWRNGEAYVDQLLAAPDPVNNELTAYFSGSALSETLDILIGLQRDNEYSESQLTLRPVPVSVNDTEVILTDCATEITQHFDAATGEPTTPEPATNTINFRVRVIRTDAGWRVDEIIAQDQPCTP